jgi:hypothetical protein
MSVEEGWGGGPKSRPNEVTTYTVAPILLASSPLCAEALLWAFAFGAKQRFIVELVPGIGAEGLLYLFCLGPTWANVLPRVCAAAQARD